MKFRLEKNQKIAIMKLVGMTSYHSFLLHKVSDDRMVHSAKTR